jgi:ribonuclease HI
MIWKAFTDGASRGNPGDAGIGVVVTDDQGATTFSLHAFIGTHTNNVAEYTAFITLLKHASAFSCSELIVHADSELMVRQVNGVYRVRDKGLQPLYRQAMALKSALPFACTVRHVPREQNKEADRLANKGIDERTPLAE